MDFAEVIIYLQPWLNGDGELCTAFILRLCDVNKKPLEGHASVRPLSGVLFRFLLALRRGHGTAQGVRQRTES